MNEAPLPDYLLPDKKAKLPERFNHSVLVVFSVKSTTQKEAQDIVHQIIPKLKVPSGEITEDIVCKARSVKNMRVVQTDSTRNP